MGVTCLSSACMSTFLQLRNPQGKEESWFLGQPQVVSNKIGHVGAVICTEIGVSLLTITATVEVVAYQIFAVLSLPLYLCTSKPYRFFTKLSQSSRFTLLWAVANLFFYNFCMINVPTREYFARRLLARYFPSLLRSGDREEIQKWIRQHAANEAVRNSLCFAQNLGNVFFDFHSVNRQQRIIPPPVEESENFSEEALNKGGVFLTDILRNLHRDDAISFKGMEAHIFMFVLTKVMFMYAIGEKRTEEIPPFFRGATRKALEKSRMKPVSREVCEVLEQALKECSPYFCPESRDSEPKEAFVKDTWKDLLKIAAGELQDGVFITTCWERACKTANAKNQK